jgi:Flp pilus assembly protein TadG
MEDVRVEGRKEAVGRLACAAAPQRRNRERGQALLEFALALPVLCLLSIGVVELGRAAAFTIAVNNAATAGVEYGAQSPATATDINGMQLAAAADASGGALPMGQWSATASNGCLCDTGAGTSCTYPVPSNGACSTIASTCGALGGQPVECVQVVTQDTFMPLFSYPGLPSSFTANGHAVMRVRH